MSESQKRENQLIEITNNTLQEKEKELDVLQGVLTQVRNGFTEIRGAINRLKDEQERLKSETNSKISNVLSIAESGKRATSDKREYLTMTEFGKNFTPELSNFSVSKVFQIIGLTYKEKREHRTVPYSKYMGYYVRRVTNNKNFYAWSYERCLKKIDSWLEKNNHHKEFYSKSSEPEMRHYINYLYELYVENNDAEPEKVSDIL